MVVALAAALVYFWTAQQPYAGDVFATKEPQGYYPLQAAGFRSGHLYVAIPVHPALLALKDPYDPVANAPFRVHDMSLYQGHYYLYYGITPVLIVFWPVAGLTGFYPTEATAIALFCTGAIWVGIALLVSVKRRHFPGAPSWVLIAGALCLSFATPLNTLVEGSQFYQVPISCAIFLQALMLGAVYRALHSSGRRLRWLCIAGLLFGLSLGARPNYLLGFTALLVPILAGLREAADPSSRKRLFIREATWTFLPTLLCGMGLLAYNWARFRSLSEFGMHYQLAGERVDNLHAISAAFLGPHVYEYLFSPGVWQSYFPFFNGTSGKPFGVARYFPWLWLAVAAVIPWRRFGVIEPREGRIIVLTVVVAAFANLVLLACFFGTTGRYPGDFTNAGLILAGIGALALGHALSTVRRRWLGWAAVAGLAGVSLFFGAAVYFDGFPAKERFASLARLADWPAFAWQRSHHAQFGGLRLELRLPERHPAFAEPLFEMGPQQDRRDWLEIRYLSKDSARLSFFHAGTGWFDGSAFTIPKDRHIVVETRCGSFFPPFTHPLFSGWTHREYDDARRDLQVKVNGVEVLRAALDCYEASPANLTIGKLGWFTGGIQQSFSGEVVSFSRLPLIRPAVAPPLFT
ncbi:MAG TPA: hypothetical protein VII09_08895, partial [Opitutaceae bacterium]